MTVMMRYSLSEWMAILSSIAKASDLYHRFKFIVQYLETPDQIRFGPLSRRLVTTSPHWQIPSTEEVFSFNAIFLVRHYLTVSISSNGPGIPFGMSSVSPLQPIVKPLPSRDKLRVCSSSLSSAPADPANDFVFSKLDRLGKYRPQSEADLQSS